MINSLMSIIKENPNTHLIKRIITDLVNKLSDDPKEQKLQQKLFESNFINNLKPI